MMAAAYAHRFCGLCGSLLDMPATGAFASCPLCKTQSNLEDVADVVIVTKSGPADWMRRYGVEPVVPLVRDAVGKAEDGAGLRERAKVNEVCPKCGAPEMEFYTMQLRSADEGQTVFYECAQCKYKFNLNS